MNTSTNPLDAYLNLIGQICAETERLQAEAENNFGNAPETINWGHVGNLQRKLDLLKQISAAAE